MLNSQVQVDEDMRQNFLPPAGIAAAPEGIAGTDLCLNQAIEIRRYFN